MSSNQSYTRVDTLEIKALIMKRIGHQRADKYFNQLTRLFSLKTTKSEFDKLCVRIIGRENVPLHNQLIRSILKNACLGKIPPPLKGVRRAPSGLNLSNGCPRSKDRNIKSKDRRSPLGPLGKPYNLSSDDLELISLGSRPPVEVASVEEGEEVEQMAGSPGVQSRCPVTAPFGISFRASRKAIPYMSTVRSTCESSGELPDTRTLRDRLQQKLLAEGGMMRVPVETANVLNNALDAYLKRSIEPCMSLARSRSRTVYDSSDFRFRQQMPQPRIGSMLDFRVGLESNPQILGPDWAVQLEKVNLARF
ncbi:hypothetical protein LINGRAHAP2_LOCUS35709 [Linum grandiflorum]